VKSRDYDCALQVASTRGYKEVVKMLINYKANVNLQGRYLRSPLQPALYAGYKEVATLLRDKGAVIYEVT
jgi:ankyrin repeat protein